MTVHERLLAEAGAACKAQGERFTARRRAVLSLLLAYDRPATAYDLIKALSRTSGRAVRPPDILPK